MRAYVPAPRRLERYPGLIASTLSTTCHQPLAFHFTHANSTLRIYQAQLTLANGGSALGVSMMSGRTLTISPSFK